MSAETLLARTAGGSVADAAPTDVVHPVESGSAETPRRRGGGAEPIIELDDAHVTFRTRTVEKSIRAVRRVSLKLMPGEMIGIIGGSGCGKSTTASVVCRLQKSTAGRAYFQGREVTRRTVKDRRAIGRIISVVFQNPAIALNARMAIRDQLVDPLHVHKVGMKWEREARVRELILLVGLSASVLDALPGQLSGGQRQRVAVARALATKSAAIIADEPMSALDASVRAQILNLLTDLKGEFGLAMVFISHDIQTVYYASDRIVVMNGGQIAEEGPVATLLVDPQDPYTRKPLGTALSLLHSGIPDDLVPADEESRGTAKEESV